MSKEEEKKNEKKEDDEKEIQLIGGVETAGMDGIIDNLSESSKEEDENGIEIEPAPNIKDNNNNENNNEIKPAPNIGRNGNGNKNGNKDIPRAPNIGNNNNNESEVSNGEDDDVHNKEDLRKKVEKMRKISKDNILYTIAGIIKK